MTASTRPLRVLHLTDPHLHARDDQRLRGVATNQSFARTLEHALREEPDVLLATGDLVQDESPAAYLRFRDALAGCGFPVLVVAGNHDVPARMREALAGPPFQLGGMLDCGAWRLIQLDSFVDGDTAGELAPAELHRLACALGETARPALIALHHHPVAVGSAWLDRLGLRNAADLLEILERHGNARVLLWGHAHQVLDRKHGSLRLLGTPSTCAQFRPHSEHFALDDRPPAYRRLMLYADGSLETEVVWVD